MFHRKPKHQHKWEVKGWAIVAHYDRDYWTGQYTERPTSHTTNITQQCAECGEIYTYSKTGMFQDPRESK